MATTPLASSHIKAAGGALMSEPATQSRAGVITAADKLKLDNIATGATANATNAQLRDRSTHTGTQAWSTITGAPAITGLTASTSDSVDSVAQRTSIGYLSARRLLATQGVVYYNASGSVYIGYTTQFTFSHAATGPAFTPTCDLALKENVEAALNPALSLEQVLQAGSITYDRVQDGVHALGFAAQALRDINPLWTVGGEALDPYVPPEDLDSAVVDEDGETFRRPLAIDPVAMLASVFEAIQQLANDSGYAESQLAAAQTRIQDLEDQQALMLTRLEALEAA